MRQYAFGEVEPLGELRQLTGVLGKLVRLPIAHLRKSPLDQLFGVRETRRHGFEPCYVFRPDARRSRTPRPDAALDEIEQLLAEPGFLSVHTLQLDPRWDPIREHPRFQRLLEQYEN